jgi:hypothetical protein
MATFFSNIAAFKAKASEVENDASFLSSLESTIDTALVTYIEPYIGAALIQTLKTAYSGSPTTKQSIAIGHLQSALAALALYDWSYQGALRTGNQGMTAPENRPFKYEKNDYRKKKINEGKEALERLLIYLEQNKSDFLDWDSEKHFAHFLNTAAAFRTAYSDGISRPVFDALFGIIDRVEYECIEKELPKQFFNQLKTAFQSVTLSAAQLKLIKLFRVAIANFTIDEAMQRDMVQRRNGYIVMAMQDNQADSRGSFRNATRDMVAYSGESHRVWASQSMKRWRDFLIANKADYPLCFSTADGGTNTDADAWDTRPVVEETTAVAYDPFAAPKGKRIIAL